MKIKTLFILLAFSFLVISCVDESVNTLDCELGYIGENCDSCADGYVKSAKYCIYDCSDIENVDTVSETNNTCICKEGYSFDKVNRVCDELVLNCSRDGDCDLGNICDTSNGVETAICIEGCRVDRDCESDKICDTITKKCKGDSPTEDCRVEDTCEQGYICNVTSGDCELKAFCNTNEDCAVNYECNNSECTAIPTCSSDEDCENGEVCKDNNYCGIYIGCESNDYCIDQDATKPICNINSGVCYECLENIHCGEYKICDAIENICIDEFEECLVDSDCGLNKRCDTSTNPNECVDLVIGCMSDDDCDDGLHCKNDGNCVLCLDDSQCLESDTCNLDSNICENENGANGLCRDDIGPEMCVLLGGICDANNNNCIFDENPQCEDDTCSENPNTHCDLNESNVPTCYCDDGYHYNDTGDTCIEDSCVPNCLNKVCGDDGCGGLCGTCNANEFCSNSNLCELRSTLSPIAECDIEVNGNSIGDYAEVEPAIDGGTNPPSIITLSGGNSYDPSGETLTYLWEKVSAPTGSVAVPRTPTMEESSYFVDLSGEHKLKLTVTNQSGLSSSCELTVNGVTSNALHIELFWDKPGDLDLHLKKFGTNDAAFGTSDDCHWQNCKTGLDWGTPGDINNPNLDRDDITDRGPENININTPEITPAGEHYTIGVKNFSHNDNPTATIRIYCNGRNQFEHSMNLPIAGASFWKVANIEWREYGCNISPINTVGDYPGASGTK